MLFLAAILAVNSLQVGEKLPAEHPVLPQFYRPPSHGPTLVELSTRVKVGSKTAGSSGTVTLPIPSEYSGQTTIEFRVDCVPNTALKSWRIADRNEGINRAVQISVSPGPEGAVVSFSARVLAPGFEVVRTQRRDFKDWLNPSLCVQSKDSEILELAHKLSVDKPQRSTFVDRVVTWVATNHKGQFVASGDSDALSSLQSGGDCLARANLCAAILRSVGIPARTIAYFPTWADGLEAQWWLTEYGTDQENWEMVDPTVGIHRPVRNSAIVLAIPSVQDENRSTSKEVPLGVNGPLGTTPSISPELEWLSNEVGKRLSSIHLIRTFRPQSGAKLMTSAYRRCQKVMQSGRAGLPEWFDESAFNSALALGPNNLALFMDGRPTLPHH